MKNTIKGINAFFNVSIFTSVIVFAVGIFLFINPSAVIDIIAVVIGLLFLVPGVTSLVDYFKEKNQASLITGIITIIVSIIIMAYRKIIASILPFIFGIFFVVNGINRLQYALEIKKAYNVKDSKPILMAILIILVGIIFIIYPLTVAETAFQIMGLFLCIYALLDISNHIMVKRSVNEVSKAMKDAVIEIEAKEK